jgi:hypothetical protein
MDIDNSSMSSSSSSSIRTIEYFLIIIIHLSIINKNVARGGPPPILIKPANAPFIGSAPRRLPSPVFFDSGIAKVNHFFVVNQKTNK